jgi:hypothetical protein
VIRSVRRDWLSDQRSTLLQITKAAMESNVSPPPESNN